MFPLSVVLTLAFIPSLNALHLAHLAPQRAQLVPQRRAEYQGGWPLALPGSTCPSSAPVACNPTSKSLNPACCPEGQTCFGTWNPRCCPTDSDCVSVARNIPSCANRSWNMYALGNNNYFCCEPGQYGVMPLEGYSGICAANDVVVANSLIATTVSQVGGGGGGSVATAGSSAATTGAYNAPTTAAGKTTAAAAAATTGGTTNPTSGASSSGSGSSRGSSSNDDDNDDDNKKPLSTGAIAGIAVGGFAALLVVAFFIWKCRRRAPIQNTREPAMYGAAAQGAYPQPQYQERPPVYQIPVKENKEPVVVGVGGGGGGGGGGYPQGGELPGQTGYGYGHGHPVPVHEMPPTQGQGAQVSMQQAQQQAWRGRAEMGSE